MAKEKYRLQVVLEMREKAKKAAAQFVALRRQQLAAAEEELERRKQAVTQNLQMQRNTQDTMFAKMNEGGTEARKIVSYRTHLSDLRDDEIILRDNVTKQEKAVQQAESEVEKALELLAESAKEMKVIETHKDNWKTDKRRESERKEQKLNDEIGAILYSPKRG